MRGRWLALVVVLLTAGCGGVEGSAVPQSTPEPWDPCSIPAEAIAATGLDPEIVEAGWGEGISVPEWEQCLWQGPAAGPWYFFGVLFSSSVPLTDIRSKQENYGFTELLLDDREAVQFHTTALDVDESCNVAFETARGTAWLSVDVMGGLAPQIEPCVALERHATDLSAIFPQPH